MQPTIFNYDGMLGLDDFVAKYPDVIAMSSNAKVTSALTKTQYIYYDYQAGTYKTESRHGRL